MQRVEEFVERALYGPAGFYETGGRAGRRGASFVTSVESGPLFGAVIARALDAWWSAAGEPEEWIVVDAGAGPGTLTRTIRTAEPRCAGALRLVCVERSAAQRDLHDAADESSTELPPQADVIVANELLDNLPFGIEEETDDGWVAVHVDDDGSTSPDAGGRRRPVVPMASAWVDDARARLRPGGRLVCFDYADTTADLQERPWTEWVRAFAGHEQLADPLVEPGTRDVTVVVPHDQLPTPTSSTTQADWLRAHGIDELVEEGRRHWDAHAAAPDVRAMRMRSRINEADALIDPAGLGAFWVGEWLA
ncbi:SAM-dependent methyltransferase [Actinospongicola halichondriae]|uniref:SAM-dependent methyltransferase n=1 Tax=Actinospongicola halichondriae TaxID=3236844 RepID=UPI003D3A5BAF